MKRPQLLAICSLSLAAALPLCAEDIFKVDFESGSPGQDVVTAENALPDKLPGTDLTYVVNVPNVSLKLAKDGALPGQYLLLTDNDKANTSFFCRWAEDAEDKVVSSGVLTVSWSMNFVSGADGDVSFQILRPDLSKDAARLARINISSTGQIKIGGSNQTGAANDFPVSKTFSTGAEHKFVWTLDFSTGVQTLSVDGGALLEYSSISRAEQNFFTGAPAVALKVEVRGNDAVVAFDDIVVSTN